MPRGAKLEEIREKPHWIFRLFPTDRPNRSADCLRRFGNIIRGFNGAGIHHKGLVHSCSAGFWFQPFFRLLPSTNGSGGRGFTLRQIKNRKVVEAPTNSLIRAGRRRTVPKGFRTGHSTQSFALLWEEGKASLGGANEHRLEACATLLSWESSDALANTHKLAITLRAETPD